MTRKQALETLLAKVEAGDDSAHFWKVWVPGGEDARLAYVAKAAFDGSLDAALALHNAALPDRPMGISFGGEYGATVTLPPTWDKMSITESNLVPSRAVLMADLRAIIAECGE